MEKRAFEKLGIQTSLLGFGCMRFPLTADQKIDEAEAENMIDRAIAAGVNYIDTAYPYHNGDSEPFVGRVLEKYDRDSYYLATKLPIWKLDTLEDAKKVFEEQMERLHKDYVDFYLLHALDRAKFENRKKEIERLVAQMNAEYGAGTATLELRDQYYNMREKIEPVMHIIDTAFAAMEAVGVKPNVKPIRGGTDGAQLSFKGLPCPNIFAGGLNFHGRYEFVPVQNMEKAMKVIVKIAELVASK